MNKLTSLILLLLLSVTPVFARPIGFRQNESYTQSQTVTLPALSQPRTVKLILNSTNPIKEPIIINAFSQEDVPSQTISELIIQPVTYTITDSSQGIDASALADHDPTTYIDYSIARANNTSWTVELPQPTVVTGLSFALDPASIPPETLTIQGGLSRQSATPLIANIPFRPSVSFPQQSYQFFQITLTYAQPFRLQDIKITTQAQSLQQTQVLFVAEPGNTYQILANPTGPGVRSNSTVGDLANSPDILTLPITLGPNPNYMPPDTDQDSIPDSTDNCPSHSNPDQIDSNRNGVGDACEDTDQDSIIDKTDNCLTRANSNQQDLDRDGSGDACDSLDNRLTEQYPWLPWVALSLVLTAILGLFFKLLTSPHLQSPNPPINDSHET